jgi:hypothetical protein
MASQELLASGLRCASLAVAFPFSLINPTLYKKMAIQG